MSGQDVATAEASDVVLLLLAAPSKDDAQVDRINGVTRLEKLLYLLDQQTDIGHQVDDWFTFSAYNYGPYSKAVYETVDLLEEAGLVVEERRLLGETLDEIEEATAISGDVEGVERCFRLTKDGRAVADLLGRLHPNVLTPISELKDKYGTMPLSQLIRYVYTRYPDSAKRSLIREQVLGAQES